MKKIFIILFCSIITVLNLKAQIQVDNTQTADWYVKNVLLGGGVTVSNVTFQGDLKQIGSFTNGTTTNLGINNGLILASGGVTGVIGPNSTSSKTISVSNLLNTDPDIASLVSLTINDPAILEFDFVPIGDSLEFEYVFGSEEYPEFVNSSFNDIFGFFLSGPGITGTFLNNAQNIALVPGTTNFVSIDNISPLTNSQYYIDNTSGITIEYDGLTTVLKAKAKVKPCQTYHIKLVIADLGDHSYDSGVFLKGGSFSSHGTGVSLKYSAKSGLEAAIEGCSDATIEFDAGYNVLQDTTIMYTIGGVPQNGIDYQTLSGSMTILKGQKTGIITITAIEDSIPESVENVEITFQIYDVCLGASTTTVTVPITDAPLISVPKNTFDCKATSITPNVVGSGKYQWYTDNVGGILLGTSVASNPSTSIDLADITDVTGVSPNRTYKVWVEERDDKSFNVRTDFTKFAFASGVYKDANLSENVIKFNVISGLVFDGLDVKYRCLNTSGSLTIHVYDVNGIEIGSNTMSVVNTASDILSFTGLNITLPVGNNYTIGFTGTDVDILWASSGSSTAYPYTFKYLGNSVISITGPQSSIASIYPNSSSYLFNWKIRKSFIKDNLCDRVPVLITETCKVCDKPKSLIISEGWHVSFCENDSLKLNAVYTLGTSQNGGYTYSWFKSGVLLSTNQTYKPLTVNKTTGSGLYTIRIEDGNVGNSSCYLDSSINVAVDAIPTITAQSQTICYGESTKLVGTGANSFVWSGGITDNTSFSPTATTTYTVTGTDVNTCKNTASATVTVNALPTITAQSKTICYGTSTILVGAGANSYVWNGGITDNTSFSPTVTTTYTVTGTDGNTCKNTTTATVTVNALPTVTAQSQTICYGASTKLVGSGANSYVWSGGISNNTSFSPTASTTYTVTGTDVNTCKNTTSATVTVNSLPTITAQSQTICYGASTKLVGTGANSYAWSGGISDNTSFSPTATTTYTVTGTDGNTCKNTASATVTVNALPTIVAQSTIICFGASTKLTGTGANSYAWNGGITDNTSFSPTVTTTYTVTGIDGNTCKNTTTATVTVHALPTVTAQSQTICLGGLTKLTGTGANSYVWSGGITDNTSFSPTATTTYTVTGTDGNTCKNTTSATVTVNALPTVSAQSQTICYGASTKLVGTGANSYAWSGGISDNTSFSPTATTSYTVTGTDGNTCKNTTSATVTVNSLPTISAQSQTICYGASTKLVGTGANSYVWNGGITDNTSFSPTVTTTYTVTGTDGNTCKNTTTATVTVHALPTVSAQSQTICLGGLTKLTGTGASTYVWSGGIADNTSFSPTATTTYTVTGTDVNTCKNTTSATVTVNSLPTITAQSQTICYGASTKLVGTGANSYAWSGGISDNSNFSPTATTTYTVTGTDGNTCKNTASATVTVNALPTIVAQSTIICFGASTKLTGTGANSYAWSGGITDNTSFSPTVTTTYTVTGTDGNTCKNTTTATVTVHALPTVTAQSQTICYGASTKLVGSGANSYVWSGGIADNTNFSPTATTTYTVTGTDGNTCTNTASATVTVHALPTISAQSQTICYGASTKLVGTGANSYAWSGGISDNTNFSPTATTTYTVTGTDGNTCKNTASATVTVNALPTIVAQSTIICFGASTKLTGTGANSYAWSGGITDNTSFSPSVTTTYTVTGTDGNTCKNTTTATVTVHALPSVTAQSQTICLGGLTKLTGTGASTYVWSGGIADNTSFSPTATTTYTVTGTDVNTCTNTTSATVTVHALPTISAQSQTICYGASTKLVGTGANSYAWSGGISDNTNFSPTATTTYTVTGTDGNTCKNTASATVTVNALPTIVAQSTIICFGASTKLEGTGANSYVWSGGITDNTSFSPSVTTTYTVTGTDGNNCINTTNATVIVHTLPIVSVISPKICIGESTKLVGTGASTYVWSGGIADNTNFSPTATTTYTVTGTDVNTCTNTASATVTVYALPTITAQSQIICIGESTKLSAIGAKTYQWSDGIINNVNFKPLVNKTYFVTGVDINGCVDTTVASVSVNSLPTIVTQSQIICFGESTSLSASGAETYQWTGKIYDNVSFTPVISSTYFVTGTDLNGCKNTGFAKVTVNALPTVTAQSQTICFGDSISLIGFGAQSYEWSNGILNTKMFSPKITDFYQVVGIDINGCRDTATVTVTVNPLPSNKIIGDTLLCENTTKQQFKVLYENVGSSFHWSVTGGRTNYVITENQQYYRSFDFILQGIDTIYVTETNKYNCSHTDSIVVRVSPNPKVDFEITKDNTYEFVNTTDSLYITDGQYKELVPMSFIWNYGRENDTTIVQTWNEYLDQKIYSEIYDYGTYQIALTANTPNYECTDKITKEIDVEVTRALYVPTSFVPKSVAPNLNTFMAKGYNLLTYKMWIYDIWGNLLWYTDKLLNGKPSEGWDGTYNGITAKMDCYIWKVEAEFIDGQKWKGSSKDRYRGGYTFGSVLLLQ